MVMILTILLAGIACAAVFGGFFFGMAGFFSLFDVQYDSWFALVKFVLCFFIIGFIAEPIAKVVILVTSIKLNSANKLFLVRNMINCFFSWVSIYTADAIVKSIDIPLLAEILAVAVLYLAEIAFESKEKSIVS